MAFEKYGLCYVCIIFNIVTIKILVNASHMILIIGRPWYN